jgi:uncharacterized membrane protein YqjE
MRLLWSLPKAAPAILRHLMAYAELAGQDFERTQQDLARRLVAFAIAGVCVFFVIESLCLLVVALSWDTPYRVPAIAWMGGVFLVVAIIAGVYRSKVANAQVPFLGTVRREWAEDRELVDKILSEQD